jgi:hypothetical protein
MTYCLSIQQTSPPPDPELYPKRIYRRVGIALIADAGDQRREKDRKALSERSVVIV